MIKVSEWLVDFDSHGIYDSDGLKQDLREETGVDAPWRAVSSREMWRRIKKRGLGGTVSDTGEPLISGYEIAEALAGKLVPEKEQTWHKYQGRGTRFRAALEDLRRMGF
jgi:hypothetical protein